MDVSLIAQNSANVFAPRVIPRVTRRWEANKDHHTISIPPSPRLTAGERIEMIQPSVRARYVLSYFERAGSTPTNVVQQTTINEFFTFVIIVGSLGRVALPPLVEEQMSGSCLRGLIHMQRNASAPSVQMIFGFGETGPANNTKPTEREIGLVGKFAALFLKVMMATGSADVIQARAFQSINRMDLGQGKMKTGAERVIERFLHPSRFSLVGRMDFRSQLLLACSYAHLDGSIEFAKSSSRMSDERSRQEIVSGIKTHLVVVVGHAVYIGPVPSVYHTWCHLIAPYPIM